LQASSKKLAGEHLKTFTLEEARTLLPVLESLLRNAIAAKLEAEEADAGLAALNQRIQLAGGMLVDVRKAARQRAVRQHGIQRAKDALAEIEAIGVLVKDIETGLLDFPFQLDDEVVLLCWRLGEPDIEFWHAQDAGFTGRQALDDRFRRGQSRTPKGGVPGSGTPGSDDKPN
jgi:hypothetical protein